MQYACRAIELNHQLSGIDLEPQFIKMLEEAPSNLPELKNGATAYIRYVKPQAASLEKMALSHIVTLLADETTNPHKAYACEVLQYERHQKEELCSKLRELCFL